MIPSRPRYHVVRVLKHSPQGHPYYVWKFMPRIEEQFLESVIYLYPSKTDADNGVAVGGSGFLAAYPSETHKGRAHLYAITNRHVVRECGSPVIRLNTLDGSKDVRELGQDDWVNHREDDDIAIAHLGGISNTVFKFNFVHTDTFITSEIIEENDIGVGDEVFMAGRFVKHEGRQRNLPLLRFGNISMMPHETMKDFRGHEQECFLVEVRSLSGFSGSPVFTYIPSFTIRPKDEVMVTGVMNSDFQLSMRGPWLLGVGFADIPFKEKVFRKDKGGGDDIETDLVAYSNSGQMAVIPAWRVRSLIESEERFKMARKEADRILAEEKGKSPLRPTALKSEKHEDMSPKTFHDVLKQASRKTSHDEKDKK